MPSWILLQESETHFAISTLKQIFMMLAYKFSSIFKRGNQISHLRQVPLLLSRFDRNKKRCDSIDWFSRNDQKCDSIDRVNSLPKFDPNGPMISKKLANPRIILLLPLVWMKINARSKETEDKQNSERIISSDCEKIVNNRGGIVIHHVQIQVIAHS